MHMNLVPNKFSFVLRKVLRGISGVTSPGFTLIGEMGRREIDNRKVE